MSIENMAQKIKHLRKTKGLTLEQVANVVGVGKSTVRKWETGMIANMKRDKIAALAQALGTTPAYLMGWNTSPPWVTECPDDENPYELSIRDAFSQYDIDTQRAIAENFHEFVCANAHPVAKKKLALLGNVACGEPIFASEERGVYIDASEDIQADFCLIAKGDSMINARIFDGDTLFVKKQDTVNDGEIAVVLIEDEATVKRVYYNKDDNILTLMPDNPIYKPMRFEGEALNQIRILGKVILGQYNME